MVSAVTKLRCLLLGRKAMANLDSLLKSRDATLPRRVCLIKAMVLLVVVVCRRKRWTIKKAEHWRTDAFKLQCWRRLLKAPWTTRRSNQSILKEISPEYSLQGLTLKLKLEYFGHLMQRTDSQEKPLMLGKIEDRRSEQQRTRWLDGITDLTDVSLSQLWWWTGNPVCRSPWIHRVGQDWVSCPTTTTMLKANPAKYRSTSSHEIL